MLTCFVYVADCVHVNNKQVIEYYISIADSLSSFYKSLYLSGYIPDFYVNTGLYVFPRLQLFSQSPPRSATSTDSHGLSASDRRCSRRIAPCPASPRKIFGNFGVARGRTVRKRAWCPRTRFLPPSLGKFGEASSAANPFAVEEEWNGDFVRRKG